MKRTIRERAVNAVIKVFDRGSGTAREVSDAVLREVIRGLPKRDTDGGNSGFLRGYSVGYNQALHDMHKKIRRKS